MKLQGGYLPLTKEGVGVILGGNNPDTSQNFLKFFWQYTTIYTEIVIIFTHKTFKNSHMRKVYTINISSLDMPVEEFLAKYCTEDAEGYHIPSQEAIDKYEITSVDTTNVNIPL